FIVTHLPTSTLFPYTTLFRSGLAGKLTIIRVGPDIASHVSNSVQQTICTVRTVDNSASTVGGFACYISKFNVTALWIGRVRIIEDRKSTRLNSSHRTISYAVF